jgi:hypothetical protein
MTRCGGMATLVGREATSGTEKGGDDVTWTDANFTGLKNEKKSMRSIQLLQMND